MQQAEMATRIASGKSVQPRLIKRIDGLDQKVVKQNKLDINPYSLDLVRKGMYDVSNGIKELPESQRWQ